MASKLASSSASRPFRILALPLARLPRPPPSSTSKPAATPSPPTSPSDHASLEASAVLKDAVSAASSSSSSASASSSASTSSSAAPAAHPSPLMYFQALQPAPSAQTGPLPLTDRAIGKASEQWLKLGTKPKNSWMYWFYSKGEGLMDRIEYEEWQLKSIQENVGVKIAKQDKGEVQQKAEIHLLYPELKDEPLPSLLPKLHRMLIHRIPYHRKMMFRSLIFSPLTWPFAIIPVLPNFPMFYVLWRAWSHYKAWRGAVYLDSLLKLGFIHPTPSSTLTEVYEKHGLGHAAADGAENEAPDETSSTGAETAKAKLKAGEEEVKGAQEEWRDFKGATDLVQGKGPAPDGTATPKDMVFDPSSTQKSQEGQGEAAASSSSSSKARRKAQHPSVLLGLNQADLIVKAFKLTPTETIDVHRAVEQANLRAWKAEEAEKNKAQQ